MKLSFSLKFYFLEWSFIILLTGCVNYNNPRAIKATSISKPTPSMTSILHSPIPDLNTSGPLISNQSTKTISQNFIPTPGLTQTVISPSWIQETHWPEANQISTLFFDQSGNLWAGGPAGLVDWNLKTGKPTIYVYKSSSSIDSGIVAIAQTPDKALWVGTFGNGVSRYDGVNWQEYTSQNGLPTNYIEDLITSSDGTLWIDTVPGARDQNPFYNGDFGKFDGQHWIPTGKPGFYKIAAGLNNSIWTLWHGPDWPYGDSEDLGYFDGSYLSNNFNPDEIVTATAFTVAPDGSVWLATTKGLFHYFNHTWHKIIPPWIGKTKAYVSSIAIASDGTAWFGFSVFVSDNCGMRMIGVDEFGAYRYDGKNWTHYTTKDGLVDDKICDVTIDPDGSVWFGSYDKGISKYDGSAWTSYVLP